MNALLVSHHCLVSRLGCHICASTAICAVASVQWQPFVPLHRATALCGCLYASLLKTLGVHFIRHPCLTRKLRVLAPAAPKIIPRLLSGRKCSGMSNCGRWGRIVRNFWQALSRILAFAVVWVGASLRRLCATAIVHPLHVYERSVGFASCETLGVHFIRHPCLTRKLRVLAPAAPKIIPRLLSGVLFLVPMAGVEPARYCYQRILSPSRLPIPSHRLIKMCCKTALHNGNSDFTV